LLVLHGDVVTPLADLAGQRHLDSLLVLRHCPALSCGPPSRDRPCLPW